MTKNTNIGINCFNCFVFIHNYYYYLYCIYCDILYVKTCSSAQRDRKTGPKDSFDDRGRVERTWSPTKSRMDSLYDTRTRTSYSSLQTSDHRFGSAPHTSRTIQG